MTCVEVRDRLAEHAMGLLDEDEAEVVERHLGLCSWCARRYRFEERLRHYVRVAVAEPMSPALKARLSALRTPLL